MFPNEDRAESKLTRGFQSGRPRSAAKTNVERTTKRKKERERQRKEEKRREQGRQIAWRREAIVSRGFAWNSPRRELKGNSARNTENVPAKRARCPRPIGH